MKGVTNSKGLEKLAREDARVQGQRAGKEEDSETSNENGPLLAPKSAWFLDDDTTACACMLVDHLMCRDGRSEESLLERGAVRTPSARQSHQTARGKFLKFVLKRTLPLVEDAEIDGALIAYSNDCSDQGVQHHTGSQLLATVLDRWPSFCRCWSSKVRRNHLHVEVSILMLQVTYMRPSELLTLRKKDLVPPLVPLPPCWLVVIAASEIGVSTKTGVRDESVLMDQRWHQWVNKLASAEVWKSGGEDLEFQLPCRSAIVQNGN